MIELFYADVPPSLNKVATRGSHWAVTNAKKRWTGIFEQLLLVERPERGERVHATAVMRFPVRRTRDEGNFRWLLEKALGDALVNGRWLLDDDVTRFTFGTLEFETERGPRRTNVHLTGLRSTRHAKP